MKPKFHLRLNPDLDVNFFTHAKTKRNKVIRPKSRASALSKKVRQTDRQTFFFQKDVSNSCLHLQVSSLPFRAIKNTIKSLKNDFATAHPNYYLYLAKYNLLWSELHFEIKSRRFLLI